MKQKVQLTRTTMFALELLQFSLNHLVDRFQISYRILDVNLKRTERRPRYNKLFLVASGHVLAVTPVPETPRVLRFTFKSETLLDRVKDPTAESFEIGLYEGEETVAWSIQGIKIENSEGIDRKVVLTGVGTDSSKNYATAAEAPDNKLHRSVEDLPISIRAFNYLSKEGINVIGELVTMTESQLLKTMKGGMKDTAQIKEVLANMGLSLSPSPAKA